MSGAARIIRVDPPAAIPGGEVLVECVDFDTSNSISCRCLFDGVAGHLVGASSRRVLAIVPNSILSGEVEVRLESDGTQSEANPFVVGVKLAGDLHPVTNPAFDPDDGALYITRSGSRGQQLPVTLLRIDSTGELTDFSGDVVNPTGIAFDPSGQMFVTSRLEGTVYRITPFHEAVAFAQNLGVATGIAFDRAGRMYVGDRTGTIYRVNGIGEAEAWASLEPSVSAYHLAFGPDDALFVTGPTVSSDEAVMRVDSDGEVEVFYKGLGRPQGLAFDSEGNLYVAASLRGRRGVVFIDSNTREAKLVVAGMNVVGLAFSSDGDMAIATNDSVFSLPLGIQGTIVA